jgi:transposase-like protein
MVHCGSLHVHSQPQLHPQRHSQPQLHPSVSAALLACRCRQDGQVIDVYVSPRRDSGAARRFFDRVSATAIVASVEVVTGRAACYVRVLDEVLPVAWYRIEQYANNRIEADHAQLKRRRDQCAA